MKKFEYKENIFSEDINKYTKGLGALTFIGEDFYTLNAVMDIIDNNDKYRYNIGKPQLIADNSIIMLSILSILFIERYDLFEAILGNYEVKVLKSTYDYFKYEYRSILKKIKVLNISNSESSINIYNKISKKLEKILEFLKKTSVIEIYNKDLLENYIIDREEDDYFDDYIDDIFLYEDLETAIYSKQNGYVMFIDDYITSESFKDYFDIEDEHISNIGGLVNSVVLKDTDNYLKIIERLIEVRYEYILDQASILKLIYNCEDKIDNILKTMVKYDFSGHYKMLLKGTIGYSK